MWLPNVWKHVYTMCTNMFRPCLRHVYTMFTQSLHQTWRHVYTISCLDNIRRRIYSMWDDMFTPSLNTCLHIVWNMFTHYLRHICSMLKEIHTQCWKTWLKMHLTQFLKTFFNDICKYAYTIFGALILSCLKAISPHDFKHLHYVWRCVNTLLPTCLNKIDDIFDENL